MTKQTFSEQDVKKLARQIYGKPICVDLLDEAMQQKTLAEAADVLVADSAYYDYDLQGNSFPGA